MNKKNIIIIAALVILGVVVVCIAKFGVITPQIPTMEGNVTTSPESTSKYTTESVATFAKCVKDSGMILYAADWCPHCQRQKALFGNAASELAVVECIGESCDNAAAQMQAVGIEAFPTWITKDGTKMVGEQTFENLAAVTGCAVPTSVAAVEPAVSLER
jgi:glutaredoxin